MREAFENSLAANPDDLACWCAFADFLADHDDPRGEFMQVQLALEDSSRTRDERDLLKAREAELLAIHEREWLGELAPHLLDCDDFRPRVEHWWARGYLTELRTECLTFEFAQSLAVAPAARTLRALRIEGPLDRSAYTTHAPRVPLPPGATAHEPYFELLGAPWLATLQSFQVGESGGDSDSAETDVSMHAPGLEHLVTEMTRVEELQLLCRGYDASALFALPNFTNLQVLRVVGLGDGGEGPPIPLDVVARNPAVANLTHLLVHPNSTGWNYLPFAQVRALVNSPWLKSLTHLQLRLSNMGDDGATAIIASGILKRLGWLDLRNGTMTDHAARTFAECAATKELRRLDLSRNAVTQAGLNMLTRAGVNAVAKTTASRRELDAHEANVRNYRGRYDPDDEGREGDWE